MNSDLERVTELANLLERQQKTLDIAKEELANAKEALLQTEREDLPTLMVELGLTEVKLTNGITVSVKEDCAAAMTDATRPAGLKWLGEHGFGGLIKTEVIKTFGVGEIENARAFAAANEAECKEGVHPSTLKSFVKEQLAAGKPVPMDLFNVFPYNVAKIKRK